MSDSRREEEGDERGNKTSDGRREKSSDGRREKVNGCVEMCIEWSRPLPPTVHVLTDDWLVAVIDRI